MSPPTPFPSSTRQPSGGCLTLVMLFGLTVGTGIVFGGAALLWQVPAAWKELREVWLEAPGTVVASRVRTREVRTGNQPQNYKNSTFFYVELEYLYVADGSRFAGISPAAKQPEQDGNLEQATAIAQHYKPGDPVPVFFNPVDITASRLNAKGPNGLFWIGAFGGPLLILCGLGLAAWSWSDWKTKRETSNLA